MSKLLRLVTVSKWKKPNMTKIFVVQERHYEYNDERYYFPNSATAGAPDGAFFSLDKALINCKKKNIAWLKQIERLSDYTEDTFNSLISITCYKRYGDKIPELVEKLGFSDHDSKMELPPTLADSDWELLASILDICPFIVCSVELDKDV